MKTDDILQRAREYYAKEGNICGGALHIVLDDGNIEDENVRFCREIAGELQDSDAVDLCNALLTITEDMRHDVYCRLHGIEWYPREIDEDEND